MSLIEEALRRVKDPLVPPASTKPQPRQQTPRSPSPSTVHSWPAASAPAPSQPAGPPNAPLTLVTLAVLGLTLALLGGGAFWMWQSFPVRRLAPAPMGSNPAGPSIPWTPETATRQEPASSARSAQIPAEEWPEFRLTGVVEGLGEPYAVINGSIVAVGETIDNATLLTIADGTVTLRLADGKDRVLRVER